MITVRTVCKLAYVVVLFVCTSLHPICAQNLNAAKFETVCTQKPLQVFMLLLHFHITTITLNPSW